MPWHVGSLSVTAPLIRGLKRPQSQTAPIVVDLAISDRPAHQGIETVVEMPRIDTGFRLSVTAPLIRGLKPVFTYLFFYLLYSLSVTAPLIRGLKRSPPFSYS